MCSLKRRKPASGYGLCRREHDLPVSFCGSPVGFMVYGLAPHPAFADPAVYRFGVDVLIASVIHGLRTLLSGFQMSASDGPLHFAIRCMGATIRLAAADEVSEDADIEGSWHGPAERGQMVPTL